MSEREMMRKRIANLELSIPTIEKRIKELRKELKEQKKELRDAKILFWQVGGEDE